MSEKEILENVFWGLGELDEEAERIEFESTLPRNWPVDRYFEGDDWEYIDDGTRLAFRGWLQSRLSLLKRYRTQRDGLLTNNLDREEFFEMIKGWDGSNDAIWSKVVQHTFDQMYDEVEAQLDFWLIARVRD